MLQLLNMEQLHEIQQKLLTLSDEQAETWIKSQILSDQTVKNFDAYAQILEAMLLLGWMDKAAFTINLSNDPAERAQVAQNVLAQIADRLFDAWQRQDALYRLSVLDAIQWLREQGAISHTLYDATFGSHDMASGTDLAGRRSWLTVVRLESGNVLTTGEVEYLGLFKNECSVSNNAVASNMLSSCEWQSKWLALSHGVSYHHDDNNNNNNNMPYDNGNDNKKVKFDQTTAVNCVNGDQTRLWSQVMNNDGNSNNNNNMPYDNGNNNKKVRFDPFQ